MTVEVLRLETTAKDLKAASERDKQTYSVVPYRGKHGESRRPIYIECTRAGVVFHPDRLEMSMGSNSANVRAEVERRVARQKEYLASIKARTDDKPYLMLLVRPDGITPYYEIQSALRGLEVELGYEFVDGGWVFDFSKDADTPLPSPPVAGPAPKVTPLPVRGTGSSAVALLPANGGSAGGTRPDDGLGGGLFGRPSGSGTGGSGGSGVGPGLGSGTPPRFPPVPFREGGPSGGATGGGTGISSLPGGSSGTSGAGGTGFTGSVTHGGLSGPGGGAGLATGPIGPGGNGPGGPTDPGAAGGPGGAGGLGAGSSAGGFPGSPSGGATGPGIGSGAANPSNADSMRGVGNADSGAAARYRHCG